jgi:hypothetical protein
VLHKQIELVKERRKDEEELESINDSSWRGMLRVARLHVKRHWIWDMRDKQGSGNQDRKKGEKCVILSLISKGTATCKRWGNFSLEDEPVLSGSEVELDRDSWIHKSFHLKEEGRKVITRRQWISKPELKG